MGWEAGIRRGRYWVTGRQASVCVVVWPVIRSYQLRVGRRGRWRGEEQKQSQTERWNEPQEVEKIEMD